MALRICNPQQGSMLFLLLLLGDYKSPGFNRSNLFLRRIANPPGRLAGGWGSVSNPPGRLAGGWGSVSNPPGRLAGFGVPFQIRWDA